MRLNENITHSLNLKKMRNDFIKSIMRDDEYKKKDDKKKEIVKSCKSYKDFCNIVDSVNMKPIRKYEEKVSYEDYINLNICPFNSKSEYLQEKKRRNNLNFMITQFKINNKKEKFDSLIDKSHTKSSEIKQFLNILKINKDNYYGFIKSNCNCDDIKYFIYIIKNNLNVLLEDNNSNEENNILDDENRKEDYNFNLLNTINFLFYLSKHWSNENFSMFFIEDELSDISLNINTIIDEIKKKSNKHDKLIEKFNYIKNIFSK
ncbi:conserved Plasmodium protein, unknown function [Plasmodium gallinaceum]|uniref:Dynein attachment factor N-terminal domain-containing protein n=1 Tax=Plasmodium gallinaceum TaxID=5849 RepID=A0A1J1GNP0_PLAGA|nr:conserved Plasmodium protein, unknown function [Plasmodium gallinaceum]CRG94097.1 conserved Plasmodium protein, unknown function [Plasmodium gallinaceum]